ncbi:MAG TPA: hypothetical protein VFG10_17790 [Saprospiraceae bacterium]|nr:hypothetical protein [Saprospiraceae bacterium]
MIVFYSHGRTQTALNAKGEHANEPIILTGSVGTAIDASYLPDSKHVSVYLIMDKSYPYKPEDLIPKLKTFFDGYGLPVIFVKQLNPVEGDWCTLVIYVGGKSYRGDMTNGNLSLPEFKYNHAAIFAKLKDMYAVANKGISN